MNKFKREFLKRRTVAIFLMAMMFFGCIAPLDIGVYADDGDKYTITFIDGVTDKVISEQEVEEGHDADEPEPDTHHGYIFTGWDSDKWKNVSEDATITALYSEKKIKITIKGKTASVAYTGKEQSVTGYEVEVVCEPASLFERDKLTGPGTAVAKGTNPGTYKMGLTKDMFNYDYDPDEYDVTIEVTDGELKIGEVPRPATPAGLSHKAEYEKIKLWWKPVKSTYGKDGKVYYEVRTGNKVVKTGLTTTELRFFFDPYPGSKTGEAQGSLKNAGKARKPSYKVYSYIIHPVTGAKYYCATPATRSNIGVIHPMYVVVTIKRNTKLYTGKSGNKYDGTAKKNHHYVAIGGSRVNGENKRVVVKVNGKLRYIKSGDVKIEYMTYYSKSTYSKAAVESFVNTAANGSPLPSSAKSKKYPKRLIWVNTYNQHVYLFTWQNNKWVTHKDYPNGILCNTGKELTPYGKFTISNKWAVKKATGTRWWCIFNAVGIHEKLGDALGKPASGGCVRIPDAIAKRFYKELVRVGYTVLVY